jgi:hypothetical protein
MTEYTMGLTDVSKRAENPSSTDHLFGEHSLSTMIKKLVSSYAFLCDLMKIFEFLLSSYPKEFFDVNSLSFSRFSNFLKNLSSRILDKNYVSKFFKLIEIVRPGKSIETFNTLAYTVIGIFLNLNDNKDNPKYSEFINTLVKQSDFDVEPFKNVFDTAKLQRGDAHFVEKFREIIVHLSSIKLTKATKKMSEEEWEKTNQNENICILCYSNDTNRILIPCKHGNNYYFIFRLL